MGQRKAAVDFSFDRIGDRLSGTNLTPHEFVLAEDDKVRVAWVEAHVTGCTILDIGASDGAIARRLNSGRDVFAVEPHKAHVPLRNMWWYQGTAQNAIAALPVDACFDTALLGEVLEHLDPKVGKAIVTELAHVTNRLVVTVPNRHSKTYDKESRSRWDFPDHVRDFSHASLRTWLQHCGWTVEVVEPIVGTLQDSIWIGAVATRA